MSTGTFLFGLVAFVVFAIAQNTMVPPLLVEFLQGIPVQHTRQDSTAARMVECMVTSAVQNTVSRSMDDPLLLAAELARHVPTVTASGVGGTASGVSAIRNVVRLYKARTSLTPALRLHRSTEEATVRLMDRSKFAEDSIGMLSRMICKSGWSAGPFSLDGILAPALVIGATLVDTSNSFWSDFAVQTAAGQAATLALIESMLDREQASGCSVTRHSKDAINKFAIVAGLWQQITARLLPTALLPPSAVDTLGDKFRQSTMLRGALFDDVWQLSQTEVHDSVEDMASLLHFVQKHLSDLRVAQA
jgi:hypothetical protein